MRGKATNAPLSGVNAATPFTTVALLDGYYRYSYTIDHARSKPSPSRPIAVHFVNKNGRSRALANEHVFTLFNHYYHCHQK